MSDHRCHPLIAALPSGGPGALEISPHRRRACTEVFSPLGLEMHRAVTALVSGQFTVAIEGLERVLDRSASGVAVHPLQSQARRMLDVLWRNPEHMRTADSPIMFVEGASGVGKSYFCDGLLDRYGLPCSPEAALFLPSDGRLLDEETARESLRTTERFLDAESCRTRSGCPVQDRSWLGHLAYAWAYEQLTDQRGYYEAVRLAAISRCVEGDLVVPDLIIVVDTDDEVAIRRLGIRRDDNGAIPGSPHWRNPRFREAHRLWFESLAEGVPEMVEWVPGVDMRQSGVPPGVSRVLEEWESASIDPPVTS